MDSWVFTFCLYIFQTVFEPSRLWVGKETIFSSSINNAREMLYKIPFTLLSKQTFWEEENNPKTSIIWDKKNFMMAGHKLNNVING